MQYKEIIAVCSEIHTKHINTVCGQNVELSDVRLTLHKVATGGLKESCVINASSVCPLKCYALQMCIYRFETSQLLLHSANQLDYIKFYNPHSPN
jgi:hypothetical protein